MVYYATHAYKQSYTDYFLSKEKNVFTSKTTSIFYPSSLLKLSSNKHQMNWKPLFTILNG